MNRLKASPYFFPVVLLIIFIMNIVQSVGTELLVDEAYYWVYSQSMAFGYFDHPPLVSLYIWISDLFFLEELGVRFISGIGFIAMLLLVWNTIDHPKKAAYKPLFLLLFLSTALLNVYGFITVPDTPLLLFMALFLWAYKRYLQHRTLINSLIIALAMAGMLYSKYQGILVIFFVLISNIKVLRDPKIWLSGLVTILLFFPHLYWQYVNDFPSIRYHLFERASVASYQIEDTLLHFVNAVAIVGVTFVILYKAFFKGLKRPSLFHKGLNYIIIGFFIFFLLSSFRGHVQAQWLAPIMIPLILITFSYLIEHTRQIKLFNYLAMVNIIIIIFARILIANEGIIPVQLEFYGNKTWATHIKEQTKNVDKLFINSYQNASIYWFYAQEKPHYQKNFLGRKNQYGLLPSNEVFSSDSIAHITRVRDAYSKIGMKASGKDSIFVSFVKGYKSISKVEIKFMYPGSLDFNTEKINKVYVTVNNPYTYDLPNLDIALVFQNKKANEIYSIPLKKDFDSIQANSMMKTELIFDGNQIQSTDEFPFVGIGIKTSEKMELVKVSTLHNYKISQ
ncbi:glycosyltransferase family 39 protein [Flavobacteriaceae bacterium S356]|uniref:Glycosyltransferase family 39 protein n=1 Tax=Asprobacillus argus TaxID=3076534 RepID=A0ABU3LEC8_9FLAO|nr:glycosyltransferase family 39 protein [Flavobacteriaceae bacterium S356]